MDSTISTVEMLGTGASSSQYLFLLFGFANTTIEPSGQENQLLLLGAT